MAEVAVAGTASAGRRGPAIIRSGLLTMLAIAALGITRLIHGVLIARTTDKATLAGVGVLIGATMMAGLFLPGGIASAAAKFIPYHLGGGDTAAASAVYRLLTRIGYLGAVVLGVVVGGWALWYGFSPADAFASGLLTVAFAAYSVEKSALYGYDRVETYVRFELAGSAIAILATVVVVVAGWQTYLLPLTLGYTILIIGAWLALRRPAGRDEARVAVPAEQKREIAGYVGLASIGGLASAGLLQALPVIADGRTSREEAAYFVAAVSLVAPLYFLPRALGTALFPAMAHAYGAGDTGAVRRQADLTTRALFTLQAPFFVAAMLLAPTLLTVLYGSSFASGAVVLQILLAATYFMVVQVAAVNALSSGSRRDVRVPVFFAVAGAVAGVLAALALGGELGGPGVGIGYLLAAVISASGPLIGVARQHDLTSWHGPIGRSVLVLGAGLALAVAAGSVSANLSSRWLVDVACALAGAGAAGAILYRDIRRTLAGRAFGPDNGVPER